MPCAGELGDCACTVKGPALTIHRLSINLCESKGAFSGSWDQTKKNGLRTIAEPYCQVKDFQSGFFRLWEQKDQRERRS